jgi:hypothetical protein
VIDSHWPDPRGHVDVRQVQIREMQCMHLLEMHFSHFLELQ